MRENEMVKKLHVLGHPISLPMDMDINKDNLLSVLREANPELAGLLEEAEFRVRTEGDILVVYREGAVMG
jgi:hypothetical protein